MQDLRILQRQFKKYILEGHDEASLPIKDNGSFSKKQRIAVYQEAYFLRLEECLQEDFPETLKKIKNSSSVIRNFLQQRPSTFKNPAEYSSVFVQFVEENFPEYSEIINYEWKKCLSWYAETQAPLELTEITNINPEMFLQSYPVLGADLQVGKLKGQYYLLCRRGNGIDEYEISELSFDIILKFLQKKPLGKIIEEYQDEQFIVETFLFLGNQRLIIDIKTNDDEKEILCSTN